jgi:hypothetical protein
LMVRIVITTGIRHVREGAKQEDDDDNNETTVTDDGNRRHTSMQDPKSPYPPVLSPSSSHLFSNIELTKPIKIRIKTSSSTSTSPPAWKDAARQIEADTRPQLIASKLTL